MCESSKLTGEAILCDRPGSCDYNMISSHDGVSDTCDVHTDANEHSDAPLEEQQRHEQPDTQTAHGDSGSQCGQYGTADASITSMDVTQLTKYGGTDESPDPAETGAKHECEDNADIVDSEIGDEISDMLPSFTTSGHKGVHNKPMRSVSLESGLSPRGIQSFPISSILRRSRTDLEQNGNVVASGMDRELLSMRRMNIHGSIGSWSSTWSEGDTMGSDSVFEEDYNGRSMKKKEDKRTMVMKELVRTEKSYSSKLYLLLKTYWQLDGANKLRRMVSEEKLKQMFPCVETLYGLHNLDICPRLQKRLVKWEKKGYIHDIFKHYLPYLKVYRQYIKSLKEAVGLVKQVKTESSEFAAFLAEIEKEPEFSKEPLESLLAQPMQRLPRYRLLLEKYQRSLEPAHWETTGISDILSELHIILAEFDRKSSPSAYHKSLPRPSKQPAGTGGPQDSTVWINIDKITQCMLCCATIISSHRQPVKNKRIKRRCTFCNRVVCGSCSQYTLDDATLDEYFTCHKCKPPVARQSRAVRESLHSIHGALAAFQLHKSTLAFF